MSRFTLAHRMEHLNPSAVREILNFSNQQPEAIRRGVREFGAAVRELRDLRAGVEAQV